jgi:hypothetical protein
MVGKLPDGASPAQLKEHEAKMNLAKRYTSEEAVLQALRDAQLKFTSGQVKTKKPDNATPEQLSAWRAENGIPDAPDKYDLKLDAGMVISKEDKAMLAPILTAMHGVDAPPEAVSAGVKAYFDMREQEIVAMVNDNAKAEKETKIQLTELWGARDTAQNYDGINFMIQQAGQDVLQALHNATDVDGIKIMNKPAVLTFFAKMAREGGFVGSTPTGGDFGAAAQGDKDRLTEMLAKDPDKYYADPKNAERLRDILAGEQRRAGKK